MCEVPERAKISPSHRQAGAFCEYAGYLGVMAFVNTGCLSLKSTYSADDSTAEYEARL